MTDTPCKVGGEGRTSHRHFRVCSIQKEENVIPLLHGPGSRNTLPIPVTSIPANEINRLGQKSGFNSDPYGWRTLIYSITLFHDRVTERLSSRIVVKNDRGRVPTEIRRSYDVNLQHDPLPYSDILPGRSERTSE